MVVLVAATRGLGPAATPSAAKIDNDNNDKPGPENLVTQYCVSTPDTYVGVPHFPCTEFIIES